MDEFSSSQTDVLHYITITAGGLSLAGSLFIVYCFLSFRDQLGKTYLPRLVFFMAIANTLASSSWIAGIISVMINSEEGSKVCSVTAPLVFYSFLVIICWIMAIATENTWRFANATTSDFEGLQIDRKPHIKREIFYHFFAWIVPLIFYLDSVIQDRVGLGRFFGCWFKSEQAEAEITFMTFTCIGLTYCTIAYIIFLWHVRSNYERMAGLYEDDRRETAMLRLRGGLYVLVYICCCVWYVVFEVLYGLLETDGEGVYVVAVITSAILPLAGFLNAIIYACKFEQLVQMFDSCWNWGYNKIPDSMRTIQRNIDSDEECYSE